MNQTASDYGRLTEQIGAWAQSRTDVRAAMVIGSRARAERPADEWSDLDVILVVTDAAPYLASADWLADIGDYWITFLEPTAIGDESERRVLFDGGLDVDFALLPTAGVERMVQQGVPSDVARVFSRGMRVLLDRDGWAVRLHLPQTQPALARHLAQSEFDQAVNDFWYHTVWTAKKLRRGELWTARSCCDGYMKRLLLQVIEWHARALHGPEYDTWHDGRFIEQWADARIVAELRRAFAHYDRDDVWRALQATMDLFRWVARETAERLGYAYPSRADECASGFVRTLSPHPMREA